MAVCVCVILTIISSGRVSDKLLVFVSRNTKEAVSQVLCSGVRSVAEFRTVLADRAV